MKKSKCLSFGVLFALLLLMMCSVSVFAASTTTKNIKSNTYVSAKTNNTYYKFKVTGSGSLTVSLKNSNQTYCYVDLYDSSKNKIARLLDMDEDEGKSASTKIALDAGTYYLKGYGYKTIKFKYQFSKLSLTKNYTASKATTLKANKAVTVVQTPETAYYKWYKINVTSKKPATFYLTHYNYMPYVASGNYYYATSNRTDIRLYDANLNEISIRQHDEKEYYSYKKLKAGTYYVRLGSNDSERSITTFKWK